MEYALPRDLRGMHFGLFETRQAASEWLRQ
jgi:hypothetical protein